MATPRKKNSSRTGLIISAIFHAAVILLLFFFAAREGILGKKLKSIAVVMVPKQKPPEKPPEPPKEKPPEPTPQPPKQEAKATPPPQAPPPQAAAAKPATQSLVAPPAAPPPAGLPSFEFSDGAKQVQTSSDPHVLYKGMVESALRARWTRPDDIEDSLFSAEVELAVDPTGKITGYEWKKGSGDTRWDDSVKRVLKGTQSLNRPPPKGFPSRFLVRFDVVSEATEPVMEAVKQ